VPKLFRIRFFSVNEYAIYQHLCAARTALMKLQCTDALATTVASAA